MENLKNAVILDLDRYDSLIEKENILEYYNDYDNVINIINGTYKLISTDEALKDLGEKYNKTLKNSVPSYEYNQVKELYKESSDKHYDLQKEYDKLLEENKALISTNKYIQHMSVRDFKKWKKENK